MLGRALDWAEARGLDRETARDAARRAVQAAVGGALAWAVLRQLPLTGYFVGILAAVLIVEPSADGTLRAAWTRLKATALGCAVGLACLLATPSGWGGLTALAVALLLLNAAATFRPDWTYGIVAAVALATTQGDDLMWAAGDRIASIAVGSAIGIAASLLIWRDRAGARFDRHMGRLLDALARSARRTTAKSAEGRPDEDLPDEPDIRRRLRLAREAMDVLALERAGRGRAKLEAAENLLGALRFLDRVTAAPGELAKDGDLGDRLAEFRDAVSDAIRHPGRPRGPGGDWHDGPVTRAQRAVTERAEKREVGDARTATVLAFAMDEVDRALIALHRAWTGEADERG